MPRKITSHKEMAHVLGLEDNPHDKKLENTGWNVEQAVESTNDRYNHLKAKYNSKLNFYAVSSSSAEQIAEDISKLKSGDYVGFGARWTGHAYTLHAVKERDCTHFIYVNRGWRHDNDSINDELSSSSASSVMVFTKDNEDAEDFALEMMNAAKHESQKKMAEFVQRHHKNEFLSDVLSRGDQKTGNCTIANSNISWHFQLASDYMYDNRTTFEEAYRRTQPVYKEMRMQDRINAFQYLLNDRSSYSSDKAHFYDLMQALEKFGGKQSNDSLKFLVSTLKKRDPDVLDRLLNPLMSNDFSLTINKYGNKTKKSTSDLDKIHNAKDIILQAYFNGFGLEEQKRLIKKNSSLLKYADAETHDYFLGQDYGKYILYASDAEKKRNKFEDECNFSEKISDDLGRKKTSKWKPQTAEIKEKEINNKLMALYSYASLNHNAEKIDDAFEDLCLACCKRRHSPAFYDKYSVHTHSAQWLITKIYADPHLAVILGFRADVDEDTIKTRMKEIIKRENTRALDSNSQGRWANVKKSYDSVDSSRSESVSSSRSDSMSRSMSESVNSGRSDSMSRRRSESVSSSRFDSMSRSMSRSVSRDSYDDDTPTSTPRFT